MKKTLSLLLVAIMLLACGVSLAAGKLSVDSENFFVLGGWMNNGYCFAKVTNIGDKPIKVNAAVFEIYDEAGEALTSSDYLSAYPPILQPGEYCYAAIHADLKEEQIPMVSDYMLTVTGKSDNDRTIVRLPVECNYEPSLKSGWWTYNYLSAKVSNNTDQTIYNAKVVLTLLDKDGKVLYVENKTCYEGITPGSSIIFRDDVSSTYLDYYTEKGIEIAGWDAIAYYEIDS